MTKNKYLQAYIVSILRKATLSMDEIIAALQSQYNFTTSYSSCASCLKRLRNKNAVERRKLDGSGKLSYYTYNPNHDFDKDPILVPPELQREFGINAEQTALQLSEKKPKPKPKALTAKEKHETSLTIEVGQIESTIALMKHQIYKTDEILNQLVTMYYQLRDILIQSGKLRRSE